VAVAVTLALISAAAAQLPVTKAAAGPVTRQHVGLLEQYLRAVNAGDRDALAQFANEHLARVQRHEIPLERVVERELELRQHYTGFELYKVEHDEPREMAAVIKATGDFPQFGRFVWSFDAAKPELILNRDIELIDTPTEALPHKQPAAELAKEVDAKLTRLTQEDKFSGAVLIARNGHPLWQKAYGFADRERHIPNNLNTRFRLGSMNKLITAIAIAQLVQAGKLKYSDTIAKVLPDYPNKDVAEKVTIEQLLTHTSGLGDIFTPKFDEVKDTLHDQRSYFQLFVNEPLRFEPGKGVSYSNAAFIVLGVIVEKLSGEDYYNYVQRHIYAPAGMTSSGSFPKTDHIANLAVGYTHMGSPNAWKPNWDTLPWRGMAAGGGDSNLHDLLALSEALRNNKLIAPELRDAMFKPRADARAMGKFGYGTEIKQVAGHTIVSKGGGAPGMNAMLDMYQDTGYTVVVLSNIDPPAGQFLAKYIAERLE
jgi:CubicO group peptidase (beta-lactamase class C family)